MSAQAGHAEAAPDRPKTPRSTRRQQAGWGLHRWLRSLGFAAVAVGLLALQACNPAPNPPLIVGMNAWVGYDPLVLARDQKLLDAQQVKVVELSSSSETLRHFRNGLLDAAA